MIKIIIELTKLRLSLLVTFSAIFGFILASSQGISYNDLFFLFFGGWLITSSSLINNQILEKDSDGLMKRTMKRPIPTKRISVKSSMIISLFFSLSGFLILYYFLNFYSAFLSILSLIIYSFVYTPLKKVSSIAVFVGAIPGALPPLIGWVAATNQISIEALIIFAIQFIWQFPHFWAIAWVSDEDYKRAGFKLLPNGGGKNFSTAINIMTYTLILLPLGLLPTIFGITGLISGFVAILCGVLFLIQTIHLIKDFSKKSALRVMIGSFIYLPIVQISYILDKI
ncbi:MAG: protoheme IX farnesyltransferase [Flammeovirgaceae bacterium]|nr:protoheme IX farnesyltransferase [Flammeovirgaceae bacterium]|tara:strand:- start:478 stop:1326 length:849 start_codon:yes stop_codon:yes gene_type:complete